MSNEAPLPKSADPQVVFAKSRRNIVENKHIWLILLGRHYVMTSPSCRMSIDRIRLLSKY